MESSNYGSLTGCENCTGDCSRHKMFKHPTWVRLCQTKQDYFDAWERGTGPGQERNEATRQEQADARERQIERYHKLWRELHSEQNPTPEWFADWVARVPNFGCGCRSWLREYLRDNPPRFDDFYSWSVELHNAVNAKLGKPVWGKLDSLLSNAST